MPSKPAVLEPEVGFEPTTFRLRVEKPSSSRYQPGPFWPLTLAGSSSQYVPDLPTYGRGNDRVDPQEPPTEHDGLPIGMGRQQLHRTLNYHGSRNGGLPDGRSLGVRSAW